MDDNQSTNDFVEFNFFDDDNYKSLESEFTTNEVNKQIKLDEQWENKKQRDKDTTQIYHKIIGYYGNILDQNSVCRIIIFVIAILLMLGIIGAAVAVCCVLGKDLKKSGEILALVIPAFVSAFGSVIAIINCIVKYLFPQSEAKDVAEFVKTIVDKDKE